MKFPLFENTQKTSLNESSKKDKIFIYLSLSKKAIAEQGLVETVKKALVSGHLMKCSHEVMMPSVSESGLNTFKFLYGDDFCGGFVEALVKPSAPDKIVGAFNCWSADSFQYIELQNFYPSLRLNDSLVDVENNCYKCEAISIKESNTLTLENTNKLVNL